MAHDVSFTRAHHFDRMPPSAILLTTMLHVLVAVALYWISPLRLEDPFEDAIEVTMDTPPEPPPQPQAVPAAEPAPPPAPTPPPAAPTQTAAVQPPPPQPAQQQPQQQPPQQSRAPAQRLGLPPVGTTTDPKAKPGTEATADNGAASGFALALSRLALGRGPGLILWIADPMGARESGRLYAPGLMAHGLPSAGLLHAAPRKLNRPRHVS